MKAEEAVEHEGHVLEHIVDHGGVVTLHTCDACVNIPRLIRMYTQLIREVEKMLGWFGESWGAPVCEPDLHVETPVGMPCMGHDHLHTDRPDTIQPGDQGVTMPYAHDEVLDTVAFHLDCWLHEVGADRL